MKSTYLSFQPLSLNDNTIDKRIDPIKRSVALYIHIPFCEKKCFYCSIYTKQNINIGFFDEYIDTLRNELISINFKDLQSVRCVHIGGGTPSIFDIKQLKKFIAILKEYIPNFDNIEKVFEANTHSMTFEKIDHLSSFKNFTLNFGIQTFDDTIIKELNRQSTSKEIIDTLSYAVNKGFKSIGVDLIAGLPKSNLKTCLKDIEIVKGLNIDHIALYPLRIEPNTVFFTKKSEYEKLIPDDQTLCEIIEKCSTKLRDSGYKQYSIFHYTSLNVLSHQYAREQLYGLEWIGIGAGAYSYVNNYSYRNIENPKLYIETIRLSGSSSKYIKKMSYSQKILHELLYRIRLSKVSKTEVVESYGLYGVHLIECLRHLIEKGYVVESDDILYLTSLGIVYMGDVEKSITLYFNSIHENIINKVVPIHNLVNTQNISIL